ncbi:MAG TPA: sensor histidine kinase [Ktedonobacteraceae bacterium]|nr:sensor histidine kinase [Ktedonobacteraceae bacterium]
MQKTRPQHEYSDSAPILDTASSQRSTALHLGLSYLLTSAVALGLFAWSSHLRVPPFSAWVISLVAAAACGFLCTLHLQYSLYLLELTLSRLTHDWLHLVGDERDDLPWLARWPLGPLFLRAREVEQRIQRYRTNERLTVDVREQALQQAREAAALAERNRIARELHDSIKQHIFGINASAAAARAYWQRESLERVRTSLEDIERSAQGAQVEMQALLLQLRPAPLENTSLLEALHIQAQALGFRTGAQVKVDIAALPDNERLLPGTQEAIFRLVQEAFANIARHARAQTVWLALRTVGQEVCITVRDDGQGFEPAHVRSGMGLANLRERTRALYGSVEISSQPGQGTTVLITIPLLEALRSPQEEARQRYELARAEEMARRNYRLSATASFLGTALGWVGIVNGWWNTFLGLSVLGAFLVTLAGFVRGVWYRARVASGAGRESRAALELVQEHYRVSMGLLLPLGLGVLYLVRVVGPLGMTPTLWLFLGIVLCLGGPIQVLLWRYVQEMKRYYCQLSPEELGPELERRQQWFTRALILWGVVSAAGLILARSLFALPPVTPAQQNADGMALILLLGGLSTVWNYKLIVYLKQQLRQRTNDQSIQAQEGDND